MKRTALLEVLARPNRYGGQGFSPDKSSCKTRGFRVLCAPTPVVGKPLKPRHPGVWQWVFVFALALLAALPLLAEKVGQLKPQGYVNDFAGMLSRSARAQLTALCQEVDRKANAQIAIVTVHTLEGVPIEEFSIDLATHWGIGPKQKDRGVLILLATDDHKYRVEVGYGLEGILPDGRLGGFGREAVPLLRAGNYDGAVLLLTRRIADVIAQDRGVTLESTPALPPPQAPSSPNLPLGSLLLLLWTFGVPLVGWLLPLILFGLFLRRRGGPRGGRPGYGGWPWLIGGWGGPIGGGSWGSGGGGFGGFGGGGFGGGGASGGW
jgi:uncharacterized protein